MKSIHHLDRLSAQRLSGSRSFRHRLIGMMAVITAGLLISTVAMPSLQAAPSISEVVGSTGKPGAVLASVGPLALAGLGFRFAPEDDLPKGGGGGGKASNQKSEDEGDGDKSGDDGDGGGKADGDGDGGGGKAKEPGTFDKALSFLGIGKRTDKAKGASAEGDDTVESLRAEVETLKGKLATAEGEAEKGRQLADRLVKLEAEGMTIQKAAGKIAEQNHVSTDNLPGSQKAKDDGGTDIPEGATGSARLSAVFEAAHGGKN